MLQTLHDDMKLLESKLQNEDSNWCEKHNELTTLKHQLRKKVLLVDFVDILY